MVKVLIKVLSIILLDNRDLQITGEQFVRVVLECVRVWSRCFPLDYQSYYLSSFKITYEKLVKLGIKFSKNVYFDNVEQYIPYQLLPLSMIIQLRESLKNQTNFSSKQIRNYLAMNPAPFFYQHKYTTSGDFFIRLKIKIQSKEKRSQERQLFYQKKSLKIQKQLKRVHNIIQSISLEKLQIKNLCFQKLPDLQSQFRKTSSIDKEQKISELQNELKQLQNQFSISIKQFQTSNDLSNSELFQTDVTKLKLYYGIYDQSYEIEKLKQIIYKSDFKIEELIEKLDETVRMKNQFFEENKTLNQTF